MIKDNEICYNVINKLIRKKYYCDYVIEEYIIIILGFIGDFNLCVYGIFEMRNGRLEMEEVLDV